MSENRMYPPLMVLRDMLHATIGQDPCVWIGPMRQDNSGCYELRIHVEGAQRADMIRMIVPREYNYGNYAVKTLVCVNNQEVVWTGIPQRTQKDVATIFCSALQSNYYFRGVVIVPCKLVCMQVEIKVLILPETICLYGPAPYEVYTWDVFAQVLKNCYGHLLGTKVCFVPYDAYQYPPECIYCYR